MTSTGARALGVGALAPTLGAAAHVEAGGGLPEVGLPVLAVAFLTAGLAALVVRRRVGVVRLTVVLAVGQLGWHLTLGTGAEHAAHDMAGMPPAGPSPSMVAAHAVVTLLVALGAAGADRAVATMVAARVGAVLDLLRTGPPAPTWGSVSVVRPVERGHRPAVLFRARPLRGPPVRPAAA
ncbi:hypothetical protein [Actinomycetospora termitidis]|uniref:MFS transporter n=1 Tax=Actinomycetospora termitidis TaxID=3053470 RepID=A0ABT7MEK1_9PSEU|nr:hypothetical protein [Actinomycetospora sp. Odt1-22]MDL5157798.1 hypothetical protein [Actinomycetospora sp. Odt1-22]